MRIKLSKFKLCIGNNFWLLYHGELKVIKLMETVEVKYVSIEEKETVVTLLAKDNWYKVLMRVDTVSITKAPREKFNAEVEIFNAEF